MTKVFTLLKNGFEEIEALTVVDYLRRAYIDIKTVSMEKDLLVEGSHKIKVEADILFDELDKEEIDLIYIPGGLPAAKDLSLDSKVTDLVAYLNEKGRLIASICAGPMVLENSEVIKGKEVTSYPGIKEELASVGSYSENLVVVDENIITSRGPATAVYLALELIELLKGTNKKDEIKADILLDRVEKSICK